MIKSTRKFANFDPEVADEWTWPMAAAWFIWRNYAAVRDQFDVATGKWKPDSYPPVSFRRARRRRPGTLACVFEQAGFDSGILSPWSREEDLFNFTMALGDTDDPYGRLECAIELGKLKTTSVLRAQAGGRRTRKRDYKGDLLAFALHSKDLRGSDYPDDDVELVSREQVIEAECEISRAELNRPLWFLKQAVGWIAYQSEIQFRSLGRIDLQPPKFFGHGYEPDFACRDPLGELVTALVKGTLKAYRKGTLLTPSECTKLFAQDIWTQKDLVFLPHDVRTVWREQFVDAKATQGESRPEARASSALAGFLRGNSDATKTQAKARLNKHARVWSNKGFQYRIWPNARVEAGLGRAKPGRRREKNVAQNRYPKSLPQIVAPVFVATVVSHRNS